MSKFRYFSPGAGRAVARYGTNTLIGATRTSDGYQINPEAVTAIPETEVARYTKEYGLALKNGDLVEKTDADYQSWQAARKVARIKASEDAAMAEAATVPAADVSKDE